jgi:hypothetical protein
MVVVDARRRLDPPRRPVSASSLSGPGRLRMDTTHASSTATRPANVVPLRAVPSLTIAAELAQARTEPPIGRER